jgi:hypothetical protein
VAGLVGKLFTLLLAAAIYLLFGEPAGDDFSGRYDAINASVLFGGLVLGPLVESMIVWAMVRAFLAFRAGSWLSIAVPSIVMVPLHGIAAMSWSVLPTFTIYAFICERWIRQGEGAKAYGTVVLAHAVQNSLSLGLARMFL